MKVCIIYWSGTGNTEEMAAAVKKGAEDAGAEATLVIVSETSPETVKEYDRIAFGCPSMGDEVLEESEMEPFIQKVEGSVGGKKLGLFGSYGWGDGQWMRDWQERMENCGANIIKEPVICQGGPDSACIQELMELGAALAK